METQVADYYLVSRYWSLESVRVLIVDANESLLWLLLSPLDGAGAVPLDAGLASITSLCPPADVLYAVVVEGTPVLTGMPSNCCLLATSQFPRHLSNIMSNI